MAFKSYKTIGLLLVGVIIVLAVLVFLRFGEGDKVVVENVVLKSESRPVQKLVDLSSKKTFLVSPAFYEKHSINPYMANAMNLFLVVLNGNDKNAVQLIRVFSPEKKLLYCATNFGDELTQANISGADCLKFISDSGSDAVVFIEFPDSGLQQPEIAVQGSKITILTHDFSQPGRTAFVALRVMFRNAEEILGKTNTMVQQLS